MTKTVSIEKATQELRDLVGMAEEGVEIVLTEAGKPVARIVSASGSASRTRRIAGLHRGAMEPSVDFDEPLPESLWLGES